MNTIYAHLTHVSLQTAYKKYIQIAGMQRFNKNLGRLCEATQVYHVLLEPDYGGWPSHNDDNAVTESIC